MAFRQEASHLCDVVKPQMEKVRGTVDAAEGLMDADLYPYPSYETMYLGSSSEGKTG